jgi:thiamine kinase-like enzyme
MSSLMNDTRLHELLKKIPAFADATNISVLHGGLTNSNYRVDTKTNSYVMRISDRSTSLLGIDRKNEKINTQRAGQAGVGAQVIHSLPQENVLVITWIEAKTLHTQNIHERSELLPRIASALRKLHAGPKFYRDFYFPSVRKKYLEIVLANNYFLPDEYLQMEILIKELESILGSYPEQLVPCNNDLLAENFMDDGEKIWIIDYEYSGQNEASFEIGNMSSEIFLNDEQLTILCDAYWQKHLPEKIYRAMAWSVIARFGWVMWASIQEGVSKINFDFRTWGLKKWNSILPELKGDRYEEISENLKKYNR